MNIIIFEPIVLVRVVLSEVLVDISAAVGIGVTVVIEEETVVVGIVLLLVAPVRVTFLGSAVVMVVVIILLGSVIFSKVLADVSVLAGIVIAVVLEDRVFNGAAAAPNSCESR